MPIPRGKPKAIIRENPLKDMPFEYRCLEWVYDNWDGGEAPCALAAHMQDLCRRDYGAFSNLAHKAFMRWMAAERRRKSDAERRERARGSAWMATSTIGSRPNFLT
jgi:hypothetical protein